MHIPGLLENNFKTLARSISLIENEVNGYEDLLMTLKSSSAKIMALPERREQEKVR